MYSKELLQTYTKHQYSKGCITLCLLYKPLPAGSVPFCLKILYCTAHTEASLIFGQVYAHNQLIKSSFSRCWNHLCSRIKLMILICSCCAHLTTCTIML